MQVYTDEVIDRLNAYAWSIPPSPPVSHGLMHPEVHVPLGCLPIQITQFDQWDPLSHNPTHWSIFVPTSPVQGIGHYYELTGQSPVCYIQSAIDDYNVRRGLERGSHTIGYVLPIMLPLLEAHFALVPMDNSMGSWSSQHWVWYALQGLNHPHMFAFGMTFADLTLQMAIVSTAWELGNIS